MGGSCRGSPTATSFRQLNLEIGRRLWGSSIWEHSSSITILNCMSFRTSNPVAAQVAPMTLFFRNISYRSLSDYSLINLILFWISIISWYYWGVILPDGGIDALISSSMFSSSLIASLSAYFLFEDAWWVYLRRFLLIFLREPTRAKSWKSLFISMRRIRSTAMLVSAHTKILMFSFPI